MIWKKRLRNVLIPDEPEVPEEILGSYAERFGALPQGATVCIKVSAASDLPYPFAVSSRFVARVVQEIGSVNSGLRILLTESGAGKLEATATAAGLGLTQIEGAEFVDAEAQEALFVANPNPEPFELGGFWLPRPWVEADLRISLATCFLGTHHVQQWLSGTTRNLLGLLPRSKHRFAESRYDIRSIQQELDGPTADLYATTGSNVLAVLDGRIVARKDEHMPLRFTQSLGIVIVADDPFMADQAAGEALDMPFLPPYLAMIQSAGTMGDGAPAVVSRTGR
jgi:uncharacterized protein (DUF362 family)